MHGHNLHDDDKPRSFPCITLLRTTCPPVLPAARDKHPAAAQRAIGLVVDQANSTYRIVPRGHRRPGGGRHRRRALPARNSRTLARTSSARTPTPRSSRSTRVDPENALAFAYPHQITDEEAAALKEIELANTGESVIALIAGGAFLYFDGDKKLCGAGVMWRPNRDLPRLSFDVPVRLSSQGRLDVKQLNPKEVTFVILKEMAVKQFVFVPPGTKLGGTTYACGGFAYLYDPNGGTKEFPHARYDAPLKPPAANASAALSRHDPAPARATGHVPLRDDESPAFSARGGVEYVTGVRSTATRHGIDGARSTATPFVSATVSDRELVCARTAPHAKWPTSRSSRWTC